MTSSTRGQYHNTTTMPTCLPLQTFGSQLDHHPIHLPPISDRTYQPNDFTGPRSSLETFRPSPDGPGSKLPSIYHVFDKSMPSNARHALHQQWQRRDNTEAFKQLELVMRTYFSWDSAQRQIGLQAGHRVGACQISYARANNAARSGLTYEKRAITEAAVGGMVGLAVASAGLGIDPAELGALLSPLGNVDAGQAIAEVEQLVKNQTLRIARAAVAEYQRTGQMP